MKINIKLDIGNIIYAYDLDRNQEYEEKIEYIRIEPNNIIFYMDNNNAVICSDDELNNGTPDFINRVYFSAKGKRDQYILFKERHRKVDKI